MSRLNKQERAAQNAAQASGLPTTVCWLYSDARGDDMQVRVRAKKKLIGFEMRYWVGEHKYTRRDIVQGLWDCGADGPDR